MGSLDEHDEEAFAVWPFRRQLVDPYARDDTARTTVGEPTQPLPVLHPHRRRPSLRPLAIALPVAATTFVVAFAGAALLRGAPSVTPQLVPVAEAAGPPAAPRAQPKRAATRPEPHFVPDVVGLDGARARTLLAAHRFGAVVRYRDAAGRPGRVVAQAPRAATRVAKPGRVVVFLSRPRSTPVPEPAPQPQPRPQAAPASRTVLVTGVVGLDRLKAANALLATGVGVRIFGVPSRKPLNRVVSQHPRPGARVAAGTYVRINVSAGQRREASIDAKR